MQNNVISHSNYWDDRYLHQDTAWDMGEISPPLKAYFEQLPSKWISILIPGCGNSYEAAWLLKQGFTHITLIDISEWLVTKLREKFRDYAAPSPAANAPLYSAPLNLIAGDFFGLTGQYDLIIEQTFFCALDPSQRKEYVEKMGDLLHPGGKLAGLVVNREFDGGPAFGGSGEEDPRLFEKRVFIRGLAPLYQWIKPLASAELLLIA